ncbi:FAD-dependent monooxygenase [Streptomyces sp. NRRL S-118]|uniref:FAD-dependent monooxygenase n=1 Tax=Streptomyces sp. NRRL S-118 TaxID=1463881 RepID=UPI000D1467C0|nr:FAD-dependent monooxygenase [Streptomyces sp. NRRL S-118]
MSEPWAGACSDVAVAGAGPAGAAAAITLAHHGASVVIIDPGSRHPWKPGESLASRARPLLERLGVLDAVATGPHTPCFGNQSLWGGDTLDEVDFLFSPYGTGWHLDRTHSCLLARQAGATLVRADRMVALAACLPFGAPGRGVPRSSLIESAPFGWWYSAPLPAGTCFVMAMTDADLVAGQALHRPDHWWGALQETTLLRQRVWRARAAPPSGLRIVRTATSCTSPAAAPGWAAVGDAATTSDPIAARGIITALATGIAAADALHADAAGDSAALSAYAGLVGASHSEFLRGRLICYGRERRWDTPFWRRRRSGASDPAAGLESS